MAREHFGPAGPPQPPQRPTVAKGVLEFPEEPCGTCGEPLLRRYADMNVTRADTTASSDCDAVMRTVQA